jgi:hypothetical protein
MNSTSHSRQSSPPASQPTNLAQTIRPISQPTPQPISQPVPQPIPLPITSPISLPITSPIPLPITSPIPPPVPQPVPRSNLNQTIRHGPYPVALYQPLQSGTLNPPPPLHLPPQGQGPMGGINQMPNHYPYQPAPTSRQPPNSLQQQPASAMDRQLHACPPTNHTQQYAIQYGSSFLSSPFTFQLQNQQINHLHSPHPQNIDHRPGQGLLGDQEMFDTTVGNDRAPPSSLSFGGPPSSTRAGSPHGTNSTRRSDALPSNPSTRAGSPHGTDSSRRSDAPSVDGSIAGGTGTARKRRRVAQGEGRSHPLPAPHAAPVCLSFPPYSLALSDVLRRSHHPSLPLRLCNSSYPKSSKRRSMYVQYAILSHR